MRDITPLEHATSITILSPDDIIMGWEGTSKLIYCYKNGLDLISWLSMLSDSFIERCVEKDFDELEDLMAEDFLQIGLYLTMMKRSDWKRGVHQDVVIKTINKILSIAISIESINRTVIKEYGISAIPGSGKIIEITTSKKNKYDLDSYTFKCNPQVNIVKEEDGSTIHATVNRTDR